MKGFSGGRRKEEIFPPWPNLGNAYGICPRTKAYMYKTVEDFARIKRRGKGGEEVLINAGLVSVAREGGIYAAASIRGGGRIEDGTNKMSPAKVSSFSGPAGRHLSRGEIKN